MAWSSPSWISPTAMVYRKNPVASDELRRLAKERLSRHTAHFEKALTAEQTQHLLEELEIHHIELEMQNEHLNATRLQLETALAQSRELYDFSPAGFLSLDVLGNIVKLNLAAATLLGRERSRLLGNQFVSHVAEPDRARFNAALDLARAQGEVQDGELCVTRKQPLVRQVQFKISLHPQGKGWELILIDISERVLNEARWNASEKRWKMALEAVGDGVFDWQVQSGEVLFSKGFCALYGFSEAEYGRHMEDWTLRLHPDDKQRVVAELQQNLQEGAATFYNEHRGRRKDGSWQWVLARGAVVSRNEHGKPLRMVGTIVDISERKQMQEDLLSTARFQQAVFDSQAAHIAVLDRHGIIVQTNAAWRKYAVDVRFEDDTGFNGKNYLDILNWMTGKVQETVLAAQLGIESVAQGKATDFKLDHPFYSPLGERWFSMKAMPVHDEEQRVVVSHEDVSDLKAAELASLTLANMDALTGTLSRRNFFNLAEQELARSSRYALPLMALMLDLDHFKEINDRYGHATGDAVLQGFVRTVTVVLRESDLIGRIGGEEFALLLPSTTLEGGCALAQRIIDSVRANPIVVGGQTIVYTVSAGACCLEKHASFAAILADADAALYRAKSSGRDRLEVAPVVQ